MGGSSGGKSGQSSPSIDAGTAQSVYDRYYQRGSQGWGANAGDNLAPEYGAYAQQGYLEGQRSQAMQGFEFPEFPEMPQMPAYSGPSYEDMMAEQRKAQGIQERDTLYADYLSAADTATSYIASQIETEQSNANLLGIDYSITDEQRNERINNYFASICGAGEDERLKALMGEYGNPEGYKDLGILRGDASKVPGGIKGSEKTVGTSKGLKPTIATEDDQAILGAATVLG